MAKKIEDIIKSTLNGDAQKNALELIAHITANDFTITMNDENDESGWVVPNLGFIMINGSEEFPGPWTMWMEVNNIGEHSELPIDEHIKEFAWANIAPCGSCGGDCSPGITSKIFGKVFENTCQSNLMFTNPDAEAVDRIKKIVDIRKNDIAKII